MGVWTWLGPSLLFAASLAATAVSYFGIRKSNRTNRDAIGAADERAVADRAEMRDRDFRTWRRDALLRLAEEASQAAIEAHDLYFKVSHPETPHGPNPGG
jgi:hypothetical protein